MENQIANPAMDLAEAFVRQTGSHIFLTGKAGTGKTTFLRRLKEISAKRMIVTAPTGVAAINAGGVTLHSFFQLPFGPFVPGGENYRDLARRMFRFSKEKKKIIKSLDLLVIDEISMVRADLLDAVDEVLRRHRGNDTPFGGVQLLMIGDLHQLSPVARPEEWEMLAPHYSSVYFFSSRALSQTAWVPIELSHIYRQSDPAFIQVLNQVRENRLDSDGLALLNQCHQPGFQPRPGQGYITLTTHNHMADQVNARRLADLEAPPHYFDAGVTGEFPDPVQPAPARLCLKKGAQVMFLRNDPSPDKAYYNGKIGVVSHVSEDDDGGSVYVSCPGDDAPIAVKSAEWENIQYKVDPESGEIKSEVLGKFKQYPLKPAWAVTVHKSQGLTFDKAVIDVESAFTHGQVYVALSRCKSLEGMVLSSPIPSHGLETDPAVLDFDAQAREQAPTPESLMAACHAFQRRLMGECFDFGLLGGRLSYLFRIIRGNRENIQATGLGEMDAMEDRLHSAVVSVGEKFQAQLGAMFQEGILPQEDAQIQARITKAHGYFSQELGEPLSDVDGLHLETDNKEIKKRLTNGLANLRETLMEKRAAVAACREGFDCETYLRAVAHARVDALSVTTKAPKAPEYAESDIAHPELFQILRDWRTETAKTENLKHFQVMHQKTLVQIAVHLPETEAELLALKGVGPKLMEKYGDQILDRVNAYRRDKDIQTVILPEPSGATPTPAKDTSAAQKPAPKKKGQSLEETLALYEQGMDIAAITRERGLAASTICSHLCTLVEQGRAQVDDLVPEDRREIIQAELDKGNHDSLSQLRAILGPGFGYDEIRLVIAQGKFHAKKSQNQDE